MPQLSQAIFDKRSGKCYSPVKKNIGDDTSGLRVQLERAPDQE